MKQDKCHKVPRVTKTRRIPQRPTVESGQRWQWERFVADKAKLEAFEDEVNMDYESFMKLLSYIRPALLQSIQKYRRGPILPENRLYAVLCFLSGECHADIFYRCHWTEISDSSFDKIFFSTIDVINAAPELAMKFPTTEEECIPIAREFQRISKDAIDTCVCAIDGYMMEIEEPDDYESFDGEGFWSKFYGMFGINIQGACDHQSRFLYLGVGGPGSRHDDEALVECSLGDLIENLPGNFCAISDCGYQPTEHIIPLFGDEHKETDERRNFNYYADKCRMRIENAFGLMLRSWRILQNPPFVPIEIWRLVECIGRLHNFCIDERLAKNLPPGTKDAHKYFLHGEDIVRLQAADERFREILVEADERYDARLTAMPADDSGDTSDGEFEEILKSRNRDRLFARIVSKGLKPCDFGDRAGPFPEEWSKGLIFSGTDW